MTDGYDVSFAFRAAYVQSVAEARDVAHLINSSVLQVAQERIQILVADFDTSAQCHMKALQYAVGSAATVANTQAFWTYRALGDPLSAGIRD